MTSEELSQGSIKDQALNAFLHMHECKDYTAFQWLWFKVRSFISIETIAKHLNISTHTAKYLSEGLKRERPTEYAKNPGL